jgi:hypothetical protein
MAALPRSLMPPTTSSSASARPPVLSSRSLVVAPAHRIVVPRRPRVLLCRLACSSVVAPAASTDSRADMLACRPMRRPAASSTVVATHRQQPPRPPHCRHACRAACTDATRLLARWTDAPMCRPTGSPACWPRPPCSRRSAARWLRDRGESSARQRHDHGEAGGTRTRVFDQHRTRGRESRRRGRRGGRARGLGALRGRV